MNPLKKIAAASVAAGVLVLVTAGVASAHVTVSSSTAAPGSYATLTFKVPTESDTASTTKLEVDFPTDTPLASVSVQPHVGWTAKTTMAKLAKPITTDDGQVTEAVSRIVWTADSPKTAIAPGEFDMFNVSAGPLPDSGTVVFKALQTYSDGSVVRWIDQSDPGQPEPEHPAPTLAIQASTGTTPAGDPAASATGSSDSDSKTPLIISIIALVVAVVGAGASFARRRA